MSKSIGGFLKAPGWLFRYCPNNNNNNNNNSNEVMTCVAAGKNETLWRQHNQQRKKLLTRENEQARPEDEAEIMLTYWMVNTHKKRNLLEIR
jgi:hypothetical protein